MSQEGKRALIVVDIQHDFLPGGSLEVKNGDVIIPLVNEIRDKVKWDLVVLTQDYHPKNHSSFASNNDQPVFSQKKTDYGIQVMWPDHCVMGSRGAEIHPEILRDGDIVVQKGTHVEVDSYSGFFDNQKAEETGLRGILEENGIESVFIVGLATDYCVAATAVDAIDLGYKTTVIVDACAGIDANNCLKELDKIKDKGGSVRYSLGLIGQ